MDYSLYEPEDFAANESYLRYYFKLGEADIDFWEQWISSHPDSLDRIMNANRLIQFLSLHLPEDELQVQYERINAAILKLHGQEPTPEFQPVIQEPADPILHPVKRVNFSRRLFSRSVAAAAVLAVVVIIAYYTIPEQREKVLLMETIGINREIVKINQSQQAMQFQLEDGTVITLQPKSKLIFPDHFATDIREVKLEGEAFFQVARNTHRPFYVYHQNLVTHVLGTSFNVKSFRNNSFIEVAVRTGRVEVYERKSPGNGGDKKHSGVSF